MIGPTGTVRVLVATRPVDFRKGAEGLAAPVREDMKADPFSGAVYVFRAKRADRVKLIFWYSTGMCLFAKRLKHGVFRWPSMQDGVIRLSAAQFSALLEGLDWRRFDLAPQDQNLMTEQHVLSKQAAIGPERRNQHSQQEPEKRDHRPTIGDDNDASIVRRIWQEILTRDQQSEISRKATDAAGPGLPGAGIQFIGFTDCAAFALANATGRPYGEVARIASEVVRHNEARSAFDRDNPQMSIEQKGGLQGGEVIMLAEVFGEARIVPPADFIKTLMNGDRILANLIPQSGSLEVL